MFCPQELAVAVNALSVLIAQGLSPTQLDLLAVVFTQIGDTLATIATQQEILEQQKTSCLPPDWKV